MNRLVRSCYYQLRRIKSVRRELPTAAAIQLLNSFIISRVDYCNSILAAAPSNHLGRIQSLPNVAARLIDGRGRIERLYDLIRDWLHWLRVPQRISFKCALLAYKAQHGLVPHYIKNYCQPTSSLQCRYELRSLTGVSLIIPRTKTKFGERSFAVAGHKSWNSLPHHVKAASSIGTFKSRQTFLFGLSYSD